MLAPVAVSALVAAAYLAVAPATADLAAHEYRAWLWDAHGFTIWNANWYAGHHVPAYSLLFPPLGGLLGPREAGALAGVAAVALAGPVAGAGAPDAHRARLAHWLLAAGILASVWVGRMPFVLGCALALAAWWARPAWARASLALACGWASPVAGLFLALGATARRDAWTAAPALGGPLLLALLFPEGGSERFVASAFWPLLALSLGAAWLLRGRARDAAILNVLLLCGAFALDTAVGQNAGRLAVTAGPALLAVAGPRSRVALVVGVGLLYLQWLPAVRAVSEAHGDPSVHASFYDEVRTHARVQPGQRVEVVFTRNHWEAAHLARHVPIARGWQRQLDIRFNGLFYAERPLRPAAYRAWLRANAVAFVALPEAPLDFSARAEAALVPRLGLPLVHRSPRWRIYRAPARAALDALNVDGFAASGPRALAERWSRWWPDCVREAPGGRTEVPIRGPVEVRATLWRDACRRPGRR